MAHLPLPHPKRDPLAARAAQERRDARLAAQIERRREYLEEIGRRDRALAENLYGHQTAPRNASGKRGRRHV